MGYHCHVNESLSQMQTVLGINLFWNTLYTSFKLDSYYNIERECLSQCLFIWYIQYRPITVNLKWSIKYTFHPGHILASLCCIYTSLKLRFCNSISREKLSCDVHSSLSLYSGGVKLSQFHIKFTLKVLLYNVPWIISNDPTDS